jgi:hypothetical protein
MTWTQEPGFDHGQTEFDHSQACFNFVQQQIAKANQEINTGGGLDLLIVDACSPDQYQQGRRILVTNNWLAPGQLNPDRYEQFPATWYGLYAGATNTQPHEPIKKFNCFINRMDPIRQSWFYQLIRRNLFDQGLVSFNMDISQHIINGQCNPGDSPLAVFEHQFQQHLQIFQHEHDVSKTVVPYRNFDCDLQTAIMQTEFSIVLETYFDRNEVITVSEKIFRCLKLPRPWVMFAMKNAVAYLRDLGFDVLDDLVDHGYDSIEFAIERQIAILDQCQTMCRRDLTANDIKRCEQAAEHNQSLLNKLFKTFHADVNISISNAVKKCSKL